MLIVGLDIQWKGNIESQVKAGDSKILLIWKGIMRKTK